MVRVAFTIASAECLGCGDETSDVSDEHIEEGKIFGADVFEDMFVFFFVSLFFDPVCFFEQKSSSAVWKRTGEKQAFASPLFTIQKKQGAG